MTTSPLYLTDVVAGTFTNAEGAKLYTALAPYLATGQVVRLSLRDATPMSSSFLNSSIGDLLDHYGLEALRSSLKLVDFVPSHAAAIKQYIEAIAAASQLA
ncbi:MAG: DUF4325 domain-containing protein [Hymenobacter sp.]|nr:MAG: DUF4325 domain-containing protein [Hymenobacter sp.]